MFHGPILWRGIVYALLMIIGKLVCGLWLLRLPQLSNIKETVMRPLKYVSRALNHFILRRQTDAKANVHPPTPKADTPLSLYPAAILGNAMVARGEIGFLISAIAESKGLWRDSSDVDSEELQTSSVIFITVTWAIFLCTLVGPLVVGLIVKRVKRLEQQTGSSRIDVLGQWRLE
jgi:hypothetical protein